MHTPKKANAQGLVVPDCLPGAGSGSHRCRTGRGSEVREPFEACYSVGDVSTERKQINKNQNKNLE